MLYILYKIGFFILGITGADGARSIVSFFASLQYYVSKKDRDIVKSNLRGVLPAAPEKEILSLSKSVFINFGKYLVDFFGVLMDNAEVNKAGIAFEGLENIDKALDLGKGCIIVTGHFGNWELGGCSFAKLGYKVNVVALNHADPRINDFLFRREKKAGINIASIGSAKEHCFAALKRNEIVGIVGDRPYGESGIGIEFFGKIARIPRGAALFSIKTGAPLVVSFTYKEDEKSNNYKMIFEEPIVIKRDASVHKQLRDVTRHFISRFESYILRYPSQWYMFNRIWD